MNKNELNLINRTEKERKLIKRLALDFQFYEKDLKYFNANELVNEFIASDFYSPCLEYDVLKSRCKEYMFDEYSNC